MGTTNIYGAGAQIATNLGGIATNVTNIGTNDTEIAALEAGVTVEVTATGVGAPNVLLASESRKVIVNENTLAAMNYETLPDAVAGLVFTFICNHVDGIRITANTGDTIQLNGSTSIAAGYAESTTAGSVIKLICIDTTEWIAITIIGTWVVETS